MEERKQTIVKVQLPLASNEENPQALVYNHDRTVEGFLPLSVTLLKGFKPGEAKAYFHATYVHVDGVLKLDLLARSKDRAW